MGDLVDFKPKPTGIEIKLVEAFGLRRRPCTVCGGYTEKVPILAESKTGERVCESCLEAGNIDERLEQHARALDEAAVRVRSLIGRLSVPTYAEWQARYEQYEREWREDYKKATGEKIEMESEIEARPDSDKPPF